MILWKATCWTSTKRKDIYYSDPLYIVRVKKSTSKGFFSLFKPICFYHSLTVMFFHDFVFLLSSMLFAGPSILTLLSDILRSTIF